MNTALNVLLVGSIYILPVLSYGQIPAAHSNLTNHSSTALVADLSTQDVFPAKPINQHSSNVSPSINPLASLSGDVPLGVGTITTPPIALPSDIASLNAKEILSANNQVVSQVASMFQLFGLFITIIVTLLGIFAALLGYLARKSVQEFIQDWTNRFKSHEDSIKESLAKIRDAVGDAERSARKAAEHEQSINASQQVLNRALKDIDRWQAGIAAGACHDRSGAAPSVPIPPQKTEQASPESLPEEDAEVSKLLKGKIKPV